MRYPALSIALLAVLSGCGGATVYTTYYDSLYSPDEVTLAAANNPALAVIRANPFAADRDNAAVLAAMQGVNFGPRLRFTQTPRADDRYGYKVILDFGAPSPGAIACRLGPSPAVPRPTDQLDVYAAFCVGDRLLSEASGSVGGVSGPDDPRLRRLIADLLVALTPPYDPKRIGDEGGGG
jgi:hypothetical protein